MKTWVIKVAWRARPAAMFVFSQDQSLDAS